jgi:hypothetical protein
MKAMRNAKRLHPEIVKKHGRNQYVMIPYKDFLTIQERLADADDLLELRKAKRTEGKKRSIPLADAKRLLFETALAPSVVREKPTKKYGKKP